MNLTIIAKIVFLSLLIVGVASAEGTKSNPLNKSMEIQFAEPIDINKTCLYESKLYSIGSKIMFTWTYPGNKNNILTEETMQCVGLETDKSLSSAYWKTTNYTCIDQLTKKTTPCT